MNQPPTIPALEQAIDRFWETIPPFWGEVRAHIRTIAAERFDISVEQFHALRHIRRGSGSVSELADAKQISRAAVSQAVDVLVNKGLIARTQDTQDRRHVQLTLTEAGDALLDAIFGDTSQWMMQHFAVLSEEEIYRLCGGLEVLKKVLSV